MLSRHKTHGVDIMLDINHSYHERLKYFFNNLVE